MTTSKDLWTSVAACVLAVFIVALLATADLMRSEEAAHSPLYRSTLEGAYSRFRDNDGRVPARGGPDAMEIDPVLPEPPEKNVAAKSGVRAPPPPPPRQQSSSSPALARAAAARNQAGADHGVDITEGNQHAAKKEYDEALASFRLHLTKHPKSSLAYHRIGDILQAQGKLDEAIAAYEEALRLRPSYYCVHGHIGDILLKQQKPGEAEKRFAKLVAGFQEEAEQPGVRGTVAKFQLAKFYIDHDRNLEEAIRLGEEAASQDPKQVSYLPPLVTAYQKVGSKEKAIAAIDKILALRPEFHPYYRELRAELAGASSEAPAEKPPESQGD